jgi:hypothetical protein
MKKVFLSLLLIILLVTMAACTAGPNLAGDTANQDGKPAGFWLGLWHGLIAPFTLVIFIFNHNVSAYETHNNGGWYIFGFIFGLLIFLGSRNHSGRKAWRRKNGQIPVSEEK